MKFIKLRLAYFGTFALIRVGTLNMGFTFISILIPTSRVLPRYLQHRYSVNAPHFVSAIQKTALNIVAAMKNQPACLQTQDDPTDIIINKIN